MEVVLVLVRRFVPVEAKMQGELCEDEVFSQQAVGLRRLHWLLSGHRDQTGFLIETWFERDRIDHLVLKFNVYSVHCEKAAINPLVKAKQTHILTSCVHIAIAPLFFAQLFEGAVGRVEGEQFGRTRPAEGLAQLQQCCTQV